MESVGFVGGKGLVLDSVKAPSVPSVQNHNFLFVYDAVLSGRNRHACPHFYISHNSPFFRLHPTLSTTTLFASSGYASF